MNKYGVIFAVGCGGFIGASLRYIISLKTKNIDIGISVGTLVANILGALIIGIIMGVSERANISEHVKGFLTTGMMGGLTTFSTFSYETITLLSEGNFMAGGLNIGLNVALSLVGVSVGLFISTVLSN